MSGSATFVESYHHNNFLKVVFIAACLVAVILMVLYAMTVGQGVGLADSFDIIIKHIQGKSYAMRSAEWWHDYYIWNNSMPRVVIALVAGCGLAVGGVIMQSIMSNPLADPYTTGISSGACFGAVAAIIAGASLSTLSSSEGIVTNAFVGALVPAFIIILISRRVGNSPATLILVGTAISYFFNAMVTLLMVTAASESLQEAYLWQVGDLSGKTWDDVPLMFAVTLVGSIIAMFLTKNLNLLTIGENSAKSLGLNVSQFRLICLILLSIMTAAIISFVGIIGFIGLVAPHIVRLVIGSDNRYVMPASMLLGALMLVTCDTVARIINHIADVPVGAVISLICSPIFLILIVGVKKNKVVY